MSADKLPVWTAARIAALKGHEKIACVTAADAATARLADAAGIHLVLVGDSLAMTVLGYATTLPATMQAMLHHTAAVVRGVSRALVVADMPFLSYHLSLEQALKNAGKFIQKAGAGAVKIEGGAFRADTIRHLVANGIPVLGHIGLTPQSIHTLGGYRVQGRNDQAIHRLEADLAAIIDAGVFAVVLECIPRAVGAALTGQSTVPTIGIGAGPDCDGQILVSHDLLGLTPPESTPRFARRYAELGQATAEAFKAYRADVQENRFPGADHGYD